MSDEKKWSDKDKALFSRTAFLEGARSQSGTFSATEVQQRAERAFPLPKIITTREEASDATGYRYRCYAGVLQYKPAFGAIEFLWNQLHAISVEDLDLVQDLRAHPTMEVEA